MTDQLRQQIIALIKREVIPATGCTEPIAVALCTAYAAETLRPITHGATPHHIHVRLSANVLKNAMGVGIPGTGMIGLPIAIALGALVGESRHALELLGNITPDDVQRGRQMIDAGIIHIDLQPDAPSKLYIAVTVQARDPQGREHTATAIINGSHTHLVHLSTDHTTHLDIPITAEADTADTQADPTLDMNTVWQFATTTPLDQLTFILESRRLCKAAAEQSFITTYGHAVGRTLHSERQRAIMGDSIFSRILSYTSAACDARMAGACIPVMSNSGSGNQGIAATLPVVVYAEETFASHEALVRALTLSHLTVIYIKQTLGRLSALCGCVVAATGSSCGIAYLMGGEYTHIQATVKNMIANLTGMICDGAKPSCSMKLCSGVSTAIISAMMALEGHCVTPVEGIIDQDVDRTIRNLTNIGTQGMETTDQLILSIMTTKPKQ